MTEFETLDGPSGLLSARPGPDLAAHGYAETEYVVRGTAVVLPGATCRPTGAGRWSRTEAEYVTRWSSDGRGRRRRAAAPWSPSGSTSAAAPTRHPTGPIWPTSWCGADTSGSVSPPSSRGRGRHRRRAVAVRCCPGSRRPSATPPSRTPVTPTVSTSSPRWRALTDWPLNDVDVTCRLAVGESQSAYALTTYVNGVHPLSGLFDGFLIHSRGGATMPLGEPGRAVDLARLPQRDPHSGPRRPRRPGDHGADRDRPDRAAAVPAGPAGRLRRCSGSGRSPAPRTPTSSRSASSRTSSAALDRSTPASRPTSSARRCGTSRPGRAAAPPAPWAARLRSQDGDFVLDDGGQRARRHPDPGRGRTGHDAARGHRAGRTR